MKYLTILLFWSISLAASAQRLNDFDFLTSPEGAQNALASLYTTIDNQEVILLTSAVDGLEKYHVAEHAILYSQHFGILISNSTSRELTEGCQMILNNILQITDNIKSVGLIFSPDAVALNSKIDLNIIHGCIPIEDPTVFDVFKRQSKRNMTVFDNLTKM